MWYRFLLIGLAWGQSASDQGKTLFNQRCAACHKLEQKLIGPPLARISERRSEEWFIKFVSNSQALIQSGDPQAVAVYKEYNQQVMPPFPDLSEADLKAIWTYVNSVAAPPPNVAASSSPQQTIYPGETRPMKSEEFQFLRTIYWIVTAAFLLVALLIAFVIQFVSLKRASESS
ncbi:MAG: cytochrome c [Bacteroidia bacterium]|nr:cytochrome c [Bacteroidia bacterium]MDW8015677.1 cytochrome c [Bacteroidia bacterium]